MLFTTRGREEACLVTFEQTYTQAVDKSVEKDC